MLRAFLRFISGTSSTAAPANAPSVDAVADARNRLVAAILDLRTTVSSGSADQIRNAIEDFTAKAIADDLVSGERESEVAKAERMLMVLAYADRLARGQGLQPMAVMSDGQPAYFHATARNA